MIDAAGAIPESVETNNSISAAQTISVSGPSVFPPDVRRRHTSTPASRPPARAGPPSSRGAYNNQVHKTGAGQGSGSGSGSGSGGGGGGGGGGGTGANTGTWRLTGLAPGDYQVAVRRWTNATGQATNAKYTLEDGTTPLQTITVDQTQKPLGPSYSANYESPLEPFQTLATIHVASGTLNVVLTDNANGPVVADAVLVAAVQPIDLNWVGGGVAGPTVLTPGSSFTIERDYKVTGETAPANFTIAYYAPRPTRPRAAGPTSLLGTESITAAADKAIGNHDGTSPTLILPGVAGTYYIYATINAGGSIIESDATNDVGMVRGRTPTYSGETDGGFPVIHGPQSFYDWYHDVPGVNQTELFPLVLTKDATIPGQYDFSSSDFFPIDGKLFGNDNPTYPDHNYNFMVEFHGSFTYRGGETIALSSDDDSWVFIDNQPRPGQRRPPRPVRRCRGRRFRSHPGQAPDGRRLVPARRRIGTRPFLASACACALRDHLGCREAR